MKPENKFMTLLIVGAITIGLILWFVLSNVSNDTRIKFGTNTKQYEFINNTVKTCERIGTGVHMSHNGGRWIYIYKCPNGSIAIIPTYGE